LSRGISPSWQIQISSKLSPKIIPSVSQHRDPLRHGHFHHLRGMAVCGRFTGPEKGARSCYLVDGYKYSGLVPMPTPLVLREATPRVPADFRRGACCRWEIVPPRPVDLIEEGVGSIRRSERYS
jgi:hypothetical protein